MKTVVDAIVDGDGTGSLTLLGDDGRERASLHWSAVHRLARRMAGVLARHGVGPGSRLGLLGDTSVELVAAVQAGWLAGASITVLPPPARPGQPGYLDHLRAVVTDADLTLVAVEDALAAVGAALPRAVPLTALATRATTGPATPQPIRPAPDQLAILQYTSGSTRVPRGVPVTHRQLAANVAAINAVVDHGPHRPGRWLSWLPLYHDMGLVGFLTVPMASASPLVLQSPAGFARRPGSWLEAMSRYRSTISGAPNFAYALMTRLLAAGLRVDLRSVRFLLSGGEPVDPTMMARFATAAGRCGLDPAALAPAYGLAEATLAVAITPPGRGVEVDRVDPDALAQGLARPARPGSPVRPLATAGPPLPGTRIRIVDPVTGAHLGPRRVGRIEVSGPSVVDHYWGEPPGGTGWLGTGDLGYLSGGRLVVCGREKDVLFAAGRNVYPQDIEAVVAELPGARPGGVAAFGLPGERLVVAVESAEPDPSRLRKAVAAAVRDAVGLAPAEVVPVAPGRLPKTSSGKLRRAETRRRYLAGDLTAAAEPAARRIPERTAR